MNECELLNYSLLNLADYMESYKSLVIKNEFGGKWTEIKWK